MKVEHYLGIYRLRKKSMEEGITNPSLEGKKLINHIVEILSKMPLSEEISLDNKNGKMTMLDSKGNILFSFFKEN